MKKHWVKYYLLLGSLLTIIVSLICSFAFVQSNVSLLEDKHTFDSIYNDTKIDYIIPSPSFAQISALEIADNGIKTVTPYYETSTKVTINGKNATGVTLLFPDASKSETTPYCTSRIISGETAVSGMSAVVDKTFANKNQCKIGDTVKVAISGSELAFTVSAIAMQNTYYSEGAVALFLDSDNAANLESSNLKYSAAYVEISDKELADNYLKNDYKPLGRLKDKSEFASEEAYNQHVDNFNNADWSKEITNCQTNYSTLSVKYANVESSAMRNLIIAAVFVVLVVIIYNTVILKKDDLNKFMKELLTKKGVTRNQISSFFVSGIIFNLVEYLAISSVLYYLVAIKIDAKVADYLIHPLIPMLAALVSSIIMLLIAKGVVKKTYSMKKAVK